MDLIVNNYLIEAPITDILEEVRLESNGKYLNYIGNDNSGDVKIQCPFHANGQEQRPSCHVYALKNNPKIYYGVTHCFACQKKVPLYTLVGYCLGKDDEFGKQWLAEKFGTTYIETDEAITLDIKPKPTISDVLDSLEDTTEYLDESILDSMSNFHPYMVKRKLTKDVVDKFKIKYDNKTNCIVFPVWDEYGNLVSLTRRSVDKKRFNLESNKNKPVYLLNFLTQNHLTPRVMITESQINALTGWTYNIPSVALFGTGTSKQYDILEKSGIRRFLLAFDGDEAGRKGRDRFINYFKYKNGFSISYLELPNGKDVNDLTKEEFFALKEVYVK